MASLAFITLYNFGKNRIVVKITPKIDIKIGAHKF